MKRPHDNFCESMEEMYNLKEAWQYYAINQENKVKDLKFSINNALSELNLTGYQESGSVLLILKQALK